MKRSLIFVGASTALALAAAACGGGYTASSPTAGAAPAPGAGGAGTTISVKSTTLGPILVDGSGRTVYLFEGDRGTASTCYGACAQAWPPVTTTGGPQSGSGASSVLLGTSARTDGTTEVTYDGHPLYYFVADRKAGDIAGQGVDQFGARWYVVAPSGMKIDSDHAAVPTGSSGGY